MATRSVPVQKSKWQAFSEFVWDSENKTVIGRDAKSWLFISIFYVILYAFLAGFFIGCMTLFFKTTNMVFPNRINMDSPLKLHPGMGFLPMSGLANSITFNQGSDNKSYLHYTDDIQNFLNSYRVQQNVKDCSNRSLTDFKINEGKPCSVPIGMVVPTGCESYPYGYSEGNPCFILKLNKVYNFVPELKDGSQGIKITCEGAKDEDKKNIDFEVKPTTLGRHYFPYLNQLGYQSPYVMVRVNRIKPKTKVNVWCKAHASNLVVHRNDRAASVTFSMFLG